MAKGSIAVTMSEYDGEEIARKERASRGKYVKMKERKEEFSLLRHDLLDLLRQQ